MMPDDPISFRNLDPRTQATIEASARAAGLSIQQWLEQAARQPGRPNPDLASPDLASTAPYAGATPPHAGAAPYAGAAPGDTALSVILSRLDELSGRVNAIADAPGTATQPPAIVSTAPAGAPSEAMKPVESLLQTLMAHMERSDERHREALAEVSREIGGLSARLDRSPEVTSPEGADEALSSVQKTLGHIEQRLAALPKETVKPVAAPQRQMLGVGGAGAPAAAGAASAPVLRMRSPSAGGASQPVAQDRSESVTVSPAVEQLNQLAGRINEIGSSRSGLAAGPGADHGSASPAPRSATTKDESTTAEDESATAFMRRRARKKMTGTGAGEEPPVLRPDPPRATPRQLVANAAASKPSAPANAASAAPAPATATAEASLDPAIEKRLARFAELADSLQKSLDDPQPPREISTLTEQIAQLSERLDGIASRQAQPPADYDELRLQVVRVADQVSAAEQQLEQLSGLGDTIVALAAKLDDAQRTMAQTARDAAEDAATQAAQTAARDAAREAAKQAAEQAAQIADQAARAAVAMMQGQGGADARELHASLERALQEMQSQLQRGESVAETKFSAISEALETISSRLGTVELNLDTRSDEDEEAAAPVLPVAEAPEAPLAARADTSPAAARRDAARPPHPLASDREIESAARTGADEEEQVAPELANLRLPPLPDTDPAMAAEAAEQPQRRPTRPETSSPPEAARSPEAAQPNRPQRGSKIAAGEAAADPASDIPLEPGTRQPASTLGREPHGDRSGASADSSSVFRNATTNEELLAAARRAAREVAEDPSERSKRSAKGERGGKLRIEFPKLGRGKKKAAEAETPPPQIAAPDAMPSHAGARGQGEGVELTADPSVAADPARAARTRTTRSPGSTLRKPLMLSAAALLVFVGAIKAYDMFANGQLFDAGQDTAPIPADTSTGPNDGLGLMPQPASQATDDKSTNAAPGTLPETSSALPQRAGEPGRTDGIGAGDTTSSLAPATGAPAGETSPPAVGAPAEAVETPLSRSNLVLDPNAGAIVAAPAGKVAASPLASPASLGPASSGAPLPPQEIGEEGLRLAAASGDATAQFEVAARYTEGRGVARDMAEALQWYQRAAEQGLVPAQYRLGSLYEKGQGTEVDKDMAMIWYERAARQGNRKAMHNLAVLYADGLGGEPNFVKAAEWFTQAADLGLVDSQYNLGVLYARGLGIPRNLGEAYKWFSIIADKGDTGAAERRDAIAKELDQEGLVAAQLAAQSWKPTPLKPEANAVRLPANGWGGKARNASQGTPPPGADIVKHTQELLANMGLNPGPADGIWGPKTREAVKDFQRRIGESETGVLTPDLFRQLQQQAG